MRWSIDWGDNDREQIAMIRSFLVENGVSVSRIFRKKTNMNEVRIMQIPSQILAAKKLLPWVFKKESDLRTLLDYLENRITGDEAISTLNQLVLEGTRRGKIRIVNMPYFYLEGLEIARLYASGKGVGTRISRGLALTKKEWQEISQERNELGLTLSRIALRHGITKAGVRKILHYPYTPG